MISDRMLGPSTLTPFCIQLMLALVCSRFECLPYSEPWCTIFQPVPCAFLDSAFEICGGQKCGL